MTRADRTDPDSPNADHGAKQRSPYLPVIVAAGALAGLSLLDAVMGTFTDYYFFPRVPFCSPVFPGEPYDLILNDLPCRITAGSLLDFLGVFAITSFVYQIPALVLWAVIALRERRRKRSARHFPVFALAATTFVLSFCLVLFDFWGPFEKNTQGEYCEYVLPGEPYHLILQDLPCRITSQFFLEFGLFLVLFNVPLQIPTLILWALQAYRRRLEALSPADLQRRYDEMVAANRWRDGGRADE